MASKEHSRDSEEAMNALLRWGVLIVIAFSFDGVMCGILMFGWVIVCHFWSEQDAIHAQLIRLSESQDKPRRGLDDAYRVSMCDSELDSWTDKELAELKRPKKAVTPVYKDGIRADIPECLCPNLCSVHPRSHCKISGCLGNHPSHV